jgi:hypothetical protein
MRSLLLLSALTIGALGLSANYAKAYDACGYDYRGRLHCVPSWVPGTPYDGPRRGYRRYEQDDVDWRRHFKHRCHRGELSIGGGRGRVCVRLG